MPAPTAAPPPTSVPPALPAPAPNCDYLLFVTTPAEVTALKETCRMMGLQCDEKTDPGLGHYFDLGTVGHGRVLAIKTRMGTVDFRAATSQAILFQARTGARRLIAMGMAFGLDPNNPEYRRGARCREHLPL